MTVNPRKSNCAGILCSLILTLTAVSPVAALDIGHHRELTRRALTQAGWTNPEAIDRVAHGTVATDICRLPTGSRSMLRLVLPAACGFIDPINDLAETAPFSERSSRGFHFNSLYSLDEIEGQWQDLDAWTVEVCGTINRTPDPEAADELYASLLSLVLHAVQDFYAHSNWVGLVREFLPPGSSSDTYPLWEELMGRAPGLAPDFPAPEVRNRLAASNAFISADETLGGLQTGRIRGEVIEGNPWTHRHKRGAEEGIVHELAVRESLLWLERINSRLLARPAVRYASTGNDAPDRAR